MRLRLWFLAFAMAAGPVGCGGSSASLPGVAASHGGTLLELPKGAGFVEVVVEPADPDTKAPKDQRKGKSKVVAYFVNPDGSAPPEPGPADVKFTDETGKTHPLAPKSEGTSRGARFESAPVSLPVGEATGKLDATLGGEAVSLVNRPR